MKASECKCCKCGKQAVAFFPVIDPDIPSYPYCRDCLNKAKLEIAIALWGEDDEKTKIVYDSIEWKKVTLNWKELKK